MIIVGIILSGFGIGFFCGCCSRSPSTRFPSSQGCPPASPPFTVAQGVIGALIVGGLAGGATLAIGQIVFATVRTPLIRAAIGLLYAVPAGVASYHATLGLAHIGMPSEAWREAFAVVGAILVGGTAWGRMFLFVPPKVGQGVAAGPAYLPLSAATKQG